MNGYGEERLCRRLTIFAGKIFRDGDRVLGLGLGLVLVLVFWGGGKRNFEGVRDKEDGF